MSNHEAQNYTPDFKAEVALAALSGSKSLDELAGQYHADAEQIAAWRMQLQEGAAALFSSNIKQVPRALPVNPFGPEYSERSMAERVEIAIEESAKFGRSIGAIVVPVAVHESGANPVDKPLLEDIATHLTSRLRASDIATPMDANTIVVYVSLINTADDLHSIGRRVHQMAAHYLDNNGLPEYAIAGTGVAMCPQDGTDSKDLQANALAKIAKR